MRVTVGFRFPCLESANITQAALPPVLRHTLANQKPIHVIFTSNLATARSSGPADSQGNRRAARTLIFDESIVLTPDVRYASGLFLQCFSRLRGAAAQVSSR